MLERRATTLRRDRRAFIPLSASSPGFTTTRHFEPDKAPSHTPPPFKCDRARWPDLVPVTTKPTTEPDNDQEHCRYRNHDIATTKPVT